MNYTKYAVTLVCAGSVGLEAVFGHGKLHVHVERYRPVDVQALAAREATTSTTYLSGPTVMP